MNKVPRPISEALSELILPSGGLARFQGNAELHAAWKNVVDDNFDLADSSHWNQTRCSASRCDSNAPAMSELASFHKQNLPR